MAEWTLAVSWGRLQAQGRARVSLPGLELALFLIDGEVHAIEDACPHAGASLCRGPLNGLRVQCPAHGLRFDLRTGAMPGGGLQLKVFPSRIVGDEVQVRLGPDIPSPTVL